MPHAARTPRGRAAAVRAHLRGQPWLVAVLVVGLAVRAVLVPITFGMDFVVWDRASAATLLGHDIYAHHPAYPGGPYAYLPLFLDLELPFQWLAQHTGVSFTTLGKLPIVAGDVGTAVLIGLELAGRRRTPWQVGWGTALFFLNPLVLYNSAYYGRFDTLACALLLLSLRLSADRQRSPRVAAAVFALAAACKTFPAIMIFMFVRRARAARRTSLLVMAMVLTVLSLPYLGSLRAYVTDVVLYDSSKGPQGLSWQQAILAVASPRVALVLSDVLLLLLVLGAVALSRCPQARLSASTLTLLTLLLFLLCSKVVLEQYLIWPIPWLVLETASPRRVRRPAALLLASFSVTGLLFSSVVHPFGAAPWWVCDLLAVAIAAYLWLERPRRGEPISPAGPPGVPDQDLCTSGRS